MAARAKIATLTLNPALDIATYTDKLEPERKLRCEAPSIDPGGGGINVARAVTRFGGAVTAIVTAGGPTGERLVARVEEEGIHPHVIAIAGDSRQSFSVTERSTGDQYRFVLPGPDFDTAARQAALDAIEEIDADYVVASGSLPPGLPPEFYAEMAHHARETDTRFVVDASGPALIAALEAGVFLAKPNKVELGQIAGRKLTSREEVEAAAKETVAAGKAEVLAVTLGADGGVLVTADETRWVAAPEVEPQSSVGAGDSFLGALVWRLSEGAGLYDAFCHGIATGAAVLCTPGTRLFERDQVRDLLGRMDCGLAP
jgi:6-phosphofructokinase 2